MTSGVQLRRFIGTVGSVALLGFAAYQIWFRPPTCREAFVEMSRAWRDLERIVDDRREHDPAYAEAAADLDVAGMLMEDVSHAEAVRILRRLDLPTLPDLDARRASRDAQRAADAARDACR